MNLEDFEEAVKPLAIKGLKLHPLIHRTKAPVNEGFLKSKRQSPDQILTTLYNAFERGNKGEKGCGVGLLAGRVSSMVLVDLDYKHPEADDFYQEWKDELEQGIQVRSGQGKHYYFRHPYIDTPDKLLMTSIGGMHVGVDLIADTSEGAGEKYTIIPPTIHPNGNQYRYTTDQTLADDPPEMPDRLKEYVCNPSEWPDTGVSAPLDIGDQDYASYYAENPHMLFNVDPRSEEPIDSGNRNNELSRIAGKLLHENQYDEDYCEDDLIEALDTINEDRCYPPVDPKEVRGIACSVFKTRLRKEARIAAKVQEAESFDDASDEAAPEPVKHTLAQAASVIDQDEMSSPLSVPGQGITSASLIPCPPERPDPKTEPSKCGVWLLHQPPFKPNKAGHDFNLVKLDNSFYQYCNNVWMPVRDESVKACIQRNFFDATKSQIENILSFLKNHLYFPIKSMPFWKSGAPPSSEYPSDPRQLIVFKNGIFNVQEFLASGGNKAASLKPHHPNLFTTIKLNYDFDANATCPEWKGFLASIWGSDASERAVALKQWMGHCLIPDTSQHKIGVLHGVARGGKSTIQTVIQELVGQANVAATSLHSLATDHGIHPLVGKSLAVLSDAHAPRNGGDRALEVLKSISGGDVQQVNQKFQDQYSVKLSARFMLICNEVPSLRDAGNALLARMIPLRFDKSFNTAANPPRTDLSSVLLSELSGIVNWALDGITDYVSNKRLFMPREGVEDVARIKRSLNPVGAFADDLLIQSSGVWTSVTDLYETWLDWASECGMNHTGTKDRFLTQLRVVMAPEKELRRNGVMHLQGIKINEQAVQLMKSQTIVEDDF